MRDPGAWGAGVGLRRIIAFMLNLVAHEVTIAPSSSTDEADMNAEISHAGPHSDAPRCRVELMTTLQEGRILDCPHCGKNEGERVEDHVVPNRIGPASRFQGSCGWCDGRFEVMKLDDGAFSVKALP